MAEHKKNFIVIGCSIIGCIVTLLTCGTLIGNVQGEVRGLVKGQGEIKKDVKALTTNQAEMKSEQSYLKGVVSTKLDTIQTSVGNMERQIDDLMRVP